MWPFLRRRRDLPRLSRQQSLAARPVLNRLVRVELDAEGNATLHVPRRDTAMTRTVTRVFGLPSSRRLALDALGTFVIELCDGEHTAGEIAEMLADRFKLTGREAELSTAEFLRRLARESIIGLVLDASDAAGPADGRSLRRP